MLKTTWRERIPTSCRLMLIIKNHAIAARVAAIEIAKRARE
jgi:hypothetical protein